MKIFMKIKDTLVLNCVIKKYRIGLGTYNNLGNLYKSMNEHSKAEDCYAKSLEIKEAMLLQKLCVTT